MRRPRFLIYGLSYDDGVGGNMVLHELCDRLNAVGAEAKIWPFARPAGFAPSTWRAWAHYLRRYPRAFCFGPYQRRLARQRDLDGGIVIFPEIVAGNPLGAKTVVRWLLHKPGFHTGTVDYEPSDWIAFYNPAFDADCPGREPHFPLRVSASIAAYHGEPGGERAGSAVLFRKGRSRRLDRHPPDAITLDGMSHEEMAAVLRRVERLYCYDLHTYTSIQAALCGCVPVLIPEDGLTAEQWEPREPHRFGRAYGEEQVEWAIASRDRLIDRLARERAEEDKLVRALIGRFAGGGEELGLER